MYRDGSDDEGRGLLVPIAALVAVAAILGGVYFVNTRENRRVVEPVADQPETANSVVSVQASVTPAPAPKPTATPKSDLLSKFGKALQAIQSPTPAPVVASNTVPDDLSTAALVAKLLQARNKSRAAPEPTVVAGDGSVVDLGPDAFGSGRGGAGGGGSVVHASSGTFDSAVLGHQGLVLVDVYATWCGPCKMIAPHLEQLARDFPQQLKVVKVDGDESPDLKSKLSIQGFPTLIFYRNGQEIDRISGAPQPAQLREYVQRRIAG